MDQNKVCVSTAFWSFWYNSFVQQYQKNNNAYQPSLQLPLSYFYEDTVHQDDISRTVREVVEGVNIFKYVDFSRRNSYGYDGLKMLECVLLGFAVRGYMSTRSLEDFARNDIRAQFILDGATPSHMAFQRFIHDDLTMPIEELFYEFNRYFEDHDAIDTDILYIDGTKFEANANKMTFVWMKATKKYRAKRWAKIMERIKSFNRYCGKESIPVRLSLLKEFNYEYMEKIIETVESIMNKQKIQEASGKGHRKHPMQRFRDGFVEDAQKILKYAVYYTIADGRNSFSKTDHSATFMHMKYDYYNHTNVFKPGYNVQMGSSDGYIRHIYISSDANDLNTYIPFMEGYHRAYKKYPSKTPADAGYGSYDNYTYAKEKGIGLYMKYSGLRREQEPVSDKNRFRSCNMKKDENGDIICPAGHAFALEKITIEKRGYYDKEIKNYRNEHCDGCPLRKMCTRSEKGRTLKISEKLEEYKNEVRANISTEVGKELMTQRSIQAEGIFGHIKQDYEYERLRRRGKDGVQMEIFLVAMGHNLRKYHARKHSRPKGITA